MKKTLEEKWLKAKKQLLKAQAKEEDLRQQIELRMLGKHEQRHVFLTEDNENIIFTRKQNYYVPKVAVADIQQHIPKDVFQQAFTVSYKLKQSVYNNLSGNCKEVIKKHLEIKDSPLSVTIKEV